MCTLKGTKHVKIFAVAAFFLSSHVFVLCLLLWFLQLLLAKLLQFVATMTLSLDFISIPFCPYYFVLSNKLFYPQFDYVKYFVTAIQKSRFLLVFNLISEKTKKSI